MAFIVAIVLESLCDVTSPLCMMINHVVKVIQLHLSDSQEPPCGLITFHAFQGATTKRRWHRFISRV
jgi:hypothetical protein